MIRGLWLLLHGPPRKPLVFDLPEKCVIVHMYNQVIPQMPFPWSNSIQVTLGKKPSEKHSGQMSSCREFVRQHVHRPEFISSSNTCHRPGPRQGVPEQQGSLATAESLPGPGSRTACRPLATTGHTRKQFCTISRNGVF